MLTWFEIMDALENQPEEVFAVVANQLGQNPESFAQDYSGLKKGDIALNQRMFQAEGRLLEAKQQIIDLLTQDQRHSRIIRQDVEINPEAVTAAIEARKP